LLAEDDTSLTADDRAIARFQKQRLKEFAGEESLISIDSIAIMPGSRNLQ
jgi:hypothetical protein